jgi:hypothetical protein
MIGTRFSQTGGAGATGRLHNAPDQAALAVAT